MLVLSRKINEDILLGDDIVIRVVAILGDKVRLGIEAPRDLSVHRREIYEAIHEGRTTLAGAIAKAKRQHVGHHGGVE